ncbi:MAG: glycosyltransferase [Elusimicrobia bacterium]|nr:glycosyltransferase [Elusimicrobiota bacterium]
MRLSIVVPMFNERAGISRFRKQLTYALELLADQKGLGREDIEVIVVDDGSRDGTAELLSEMSREDGFVVRTHLENRGLGAALRTGVNAATGDVIVTADADCTYPLSEIPKLLELLDGSTSIVTASPYHPLGGVDGIPLWRLMLSRSLSLLYSALLWRRIHTWTAVFRAYRRVALEAVPCWSTGFVAVTEMLVLPMLAGHRVREHPTVLHRRMFGVSKMRTVRVIGEHLRFITSLLRRRAFGAASAR